MHPALPLSLHHLPTRTQKKLARILAYLIKGPRNARQVLQSMTRRFKLNLCHTLHNQHLVFPIFDRFVVYSLELLLE